MTRRSVRRRPPLNLEVFEDRVVPATTADAFISSVYSTLLNRQVDAAGLSYWTAIDNAQGEQAVVQGVENSTEYLSSQVNGLYSNLLGRTASASDVNYWVAQLQSGTTLNQVKADFLGSTEFLNDAGDSTVGFLEQVYQKELDRPLDAAGESYWGAQLAAGASTDSVALGIVTSNEAVQDSVSADYQQILGRGADSTGLTYWTSIAQQGGGQDSVITGMMCSPEANANLPPFPGTSGGVTPSGQTGTVATHLLLITPAYVQAGVAAPVTVEALDASNHVVPSYTGTIQLSSTDTATTSGGVALPVTYTFQANDHGVHVFSVTPGVTGTETLSASDTATTSISGSVVLQVNAPAVATQLLVVVPANVQAGVPTPVLVEALDASNQVVPNYTGTIQLSSSDTAALSGGAALPLTYTFQASDHGAHVFQVIFSTTGSPTLTATDTANSTLTDTITVTVGSENGSPGQPGGPQGPGGNLFQNFPPPS